MPTPGQPWGKYLIEKKLGEGGQARVFQAYDRFGAAGHVALKAARNAVSPDQLEQWARNEAEPLHKLSHPNIVRVLDAGHEGGVPYVATELVEALPLGTAIKADPPTDRDILGWMIQLTDALACAHRAGVVHRDLKPQNVLVTSDGRPMVIDFGVATSFSAYHDEQSSGVFGTPKWMAPEQAVGDAEADHRADIFGLGGILKCLLCGNGPYAEGEHARSRSARDSIVLLDTASGSSLRRSLARIANRALAAEPQERYPTTAEMGRDLRRLRDRPRWVLAGAGVLALAAAVVVVVANLPPAAAPAPPQARLEVHFQREDQAGSYQLLTPDLTPLRSGDRIQIHCQLPRPMAVYLIAASGSGGVQLVYPAAGESPGPVTRLQIPPGRDEWLPLTPPEGTETLVLLARDKPLARPRDLVDQIAGLGPPPALGSMGLLVVDDRTAQFLPASLSRRLGATPVKVEKGFVEKLMEQVPEPWSIVRVLAFPHRQSIETR